MSDGHVEKCAELSTDAQSYLNKFIWGTAIPRECAIVVLLNALGAWILFRGRDDIPLMGWGGLASYLGPMSFILSFFTSFFGWMVGIILKPDFGLPRAPLSMSHWIMPGSCCGTAHGLLGSIIIMSSLWGCSQMLPEIQLEAWQAICVISLVACLLAMFFHPRSILRSLLATH